MLVGSKEGVKLGLLDREKSTTLGGETGDFEGLTVGNAVGDSVGTKVGNFDGNFDGFNVRIV